MQSLSRLHICLLAIYLFVGLIVANTFLFSGETRVLGYFAIFISFGLFNVVSLTNRNSYFYGE